MKPNQFQTTGIVLLVLFSTCRSAPVLNKSPENTDTRLPALGNVKQLSEQERELESLAHGSNILGSDVKVEEHHHVTYENVNGKEQEVQETEKAVINNGKVVSDVKQEVTKTETEEGEPETHVETEIDIPSKGIHEKFSEDDDNELVEEDEMQNPGINVEDVEESVVTPEALAEYLWDTQDFAKFRTSLESIVDSKIMTPEEAQGFYQDVVMEYDKLRQLNALYPFQSEDEETFLSPLAGRPQYSNVIPGLPAEEMTLPIESYAQKRIPQQLSLYGDDYQGLSDYELEQQREAYELNAAIQRQAAVDDMLKALLEEWFASAIESGDTDAAKTVSDLANYLSQRPASQYDDDRVREVLAEVFAAMANGEQEPEEESEETSSSEEIVPPEAQPLPNTEGIEQQLKNIPSKSEESKPTDNEETESSGEEDSPVGKENEIPQKSA